jgi:hypothetical protein
MKELRKTERIKAATFATVYNSRGHILVGFLGNLTPLGAMAVGEKPVKTNRDIHLEIEFHGETEIPGGHMILPARVVRCSPDEETGYYHTGFEFLAMTREIEHAIDLLVERYRFNLNIPL